jgi:hypothetical protein
MKIDDRSKCHDLDALFQKKYGRMYIGHPKLKKLAEKNGLNTIGFQSGKDELLLFDARKFRNIEVSCNLKVGIIHRLVQLARSEELKVDSPDELKSDLNKVSFRKYDNFLAEYQAYRKIIFGSEFIVSFGLIAGILQDALPLEFLDMFGNVIRWSLTILFLTILALILLMEVLCYHYRIKD